MKKLFTLFATAMILLGVQNVNAAVEYTALSGSNWGHASESPTALFDGKGTTKWGTTASDANKPYVVFKTSRAIKPTSYRVIIANDTNSNTGRNWKSWRIFGGNFASDDAATSALEAAWDLIDTKENQDLSTAQYAEQYRDLSETLSTSYSYFKIIIDSDVSHWSGWCQMGDFAFICAPAKDANNNYQISTKAELDDFSFLVSSGKEVNAKGKLIADIDASGFAYTPIGTSSHKYTGTFDGDGHYIKLGITSSSDHQGLVAYANGPASFSNLIIKGSVSGGNNCAALICESNGSGTITINRVGCEVNITSSGSANAAFVANNYAGSVQFVIQNSYNTGNISGTENNSAIGGWMRKNSQFKNVYNKGNITGGNNNNRWGNFYGGDGTPSFTNCHTTTTTNETYSGLAIGITTIVASGELCYKLNGNINDGETWTQTIGTDGYPVLFPASRKVHQYSASIYTNLPVSEGKIQIANSTDLKQFASEVNAGNAAIDAVLTGDINMFGESWPVPIGYWGSGYIMYGGHFNGQGYTISNLTYTTAQNYHGLFGVITTGALIENFNINGTVTNTSYTQFGTVGFARDNNPTIRNVHSFLNFENTFVGAKIGGILGHAFTGTPTTVTIDRCTYSGTLNSNDNGGGGNYGGIIGYTQNDNNCIPLITNCLFDGTLTNTADTPGNCTFGGMVGYVGAGPTVAITNSLSIGSVTSPVAGQFYGAVKNNKCSIGNSYYQGDNVDGLEENISLTSTVVTNEQLANGEVCYLLNESTTGGTTWTQTIGTDNHPVLFPASKAVYLYSTGIYTNLPVDDGKVQISTADELKQFAAEVNYGHNSLDAVLTDDIDLTDVSWTPIGTDTYKYYGTFDGGDNSITLAISTTESNQGLFGYAKGGATIRNLIVKGTVTCGASSAALIGQAGGSGTSGTITISRVGCEATVNGETADRIGAFVGNDWGHGTVLNIENSYNIGNITGSWLSSVVGCHANAESTFTNVYNTGTVSSHNFYNDAKPGITCTNCYSTESGNSGTDGLTQISTDKVSSGELCYLLNGNSCYEPNWFQTVGTDGNPVLSNTQGIVNKISAVGYTTQYIPTTDVTIPTGVYAYTGVIENEGWLHLDAIESGKIAAGETVILKGSEGYYSFVPTTGAEEVDGNILKGSDGTIEGDDGIYALAKPTDKEIGFYLVNSGVTIPAGKAYLDLSGSLVKVFKFVFDDDETSLSEKLRVKSEESTNAVYDLSGRKINSHLSTLNSQLKKGVYIINGKKVLK